MPYSVIVSLEAPGQVFSFSSSFLCKAQVSQSGTEQSLEELSGDLPLEELWVESDSLSDSSLEELELLEVELEEDVSVQFFMWYFCFSLF